MPERWAGLTRRTRKRHRHGPTAGSCHDVSVSGQASGRVTFHFQIDHFSFSSSSHWYSSFFFPFSHYYEKPVLKEGKMYFHVRLSGPHGRKRLQKITIFTCEKEKSQKNYKNRKIHMLPVRRPPHPPAVAAVIKPPLLPSMLSSSRHSEEALRGPPLADRGGGERQPTDRGREGPPPWPSPIAAVEIRVTGQCRSWPLSRRWHLLPVCEDPK